MNVLCLFDGMSCGQIALNRAGIKYDNYFASEIDKHAINVTQNNFPKTKQVGSVTELKTDNLPKIDLLIGGSPCQSFSNAGLRNGFDGKSGLFWEYVRILKEVKPTYFLLENVNFERIHVYILFPMAVHINNHMEKLFLLYSHSTAGRSLAARSGSDLRRRGAMAHQTQPRGGRPCSRP